MLENIHEKLISLADEARQLGDVEKFKKLLYGFGNRIMSCQEKAVLITGVAVDRIAMDDMGIQALRDTGIPIQRDFLGGVDIIELDNDLTEYLENNPQILEDFYNLVMGGEVSGVEGFPEKA